MTWREGLVSMRPVRRWVWGGVYLAAGEATDGDDHICSRGGVIEAQLVVSRKLSSLSQRCRWEVLFELMVVLIPVQKWSTDLELFHSRQN